MRQGRVRGKHILHKTAASALIFLISPRVIQR
jgi:hypothetical protein